MKTLFFPTQTIKEDRVIIGQIVRKELDMYVVQDKKNRQYTVRSVLSFDVGKTVVVKKGIILNSIRDFGQVNSFVV